MPSETEQRARLNQLQKAYCHWLNEADGAPECLTNEEQEAYRVRLHEISAEMGQLRDELGITIQGVPTGEALVRQAQAIVDAKA